MRSLFFHRIAGFIAAVFLPLAAGALWSALSLKFSAELPFMALFCAAATWPARHHLVVRIPIFKGVLSAAICAVGVAYAYWLKSATVIAQQIGVSFGDALFSIGGDLTVAIASARSDRLTLVFIAAALVIAFMIGVRSGIEERHRLRLKSAP